MGARRSPWIWWAAGALFLFLLGGIVFLWGQRDLKKPASPWTGTGGGFPGGTVPRDTRQPPGASPLPSGLSPTGVPSATQDVLDTIKEINRINEMNKSIQSRPAPDPSSPPPKPPAENPAPPAETK